MRAETTEEVLQTGTWILAILLPLAAACLATCWIRRSSVTVIGRLLFAGSLTLVASAWIHGRTMAPFTRAFWRCSVCDTSEYQVRFSDHVVYRAHRHPSYSKDVAAIASGVPHEHDWLFFDSILAFGDKGCACSFGLGEGSQYFSCFGTIPSRNIARSMLERVARAPLEQRRAMINLFETRGLGEPFESLSRGFTPTRVQFETDYVAWLDRHPEWK